MKKILIILFFLILHLALIIDNCEAQWVKVSNGLHKLPIISLAVSGSNLIADVRIQGNNIYMSSNNGTYWNSIYNNIPEGLWVSAIAGNDVNIFAGTINGLYSTSNNGINWHLVNFGIPDTPNIGVITISGNEVITSYMNYEGVTNVFLSTNNGGNWNATNIGLPTNVYITSFGINGNNIFAGTSGGYPMTGRGVYLSTNNGVNWSASNNGLPNNLNISTLVVNGTNVLAGTKTYGIFLSTNNGTNWTSVNNGLPTLYTDYSCFAINGTNIFVGSGDYPDKFFGVYKSTNNGTSWLSVNNGIPNNAFVHSLVVKGSNIFAGTNNDMYITTNNGDNWSTVSDGFPGGVDVYSFSNIGSNIFAGTVGDGVYLSTNYGERWLAINNGLNINPINIFELETIGTNIFTGIIGPGNYGYGVYRSTNYGANWNVVNNGIPDSAYRTMIASNETNLYAYVRYTGMYLSTNNGTSWTSLGNPFIVSSFGFYGTTVLAGAENNIYLSTNNGFNWNSISTGIPNYSDVSSFAVIGSNIFAGVCSSLSFHSGFGVYLSTNMGLSWHAVNNGIDSMAHISSLKTSGNNIFAADLDRGFYLSTNNGSNWIQKNEGLNSNIYGLLDHEIGITDDYIFICKYQEIWRRHISEILTSVNNVSVTFDKFILFQNYPNPFNPSTNIRYEIPKNGFVKLVVYDILGREVQTLVNEKQNAGTYEVNFNGSNLASGIYFYTLTSGDFKQTKKLVLLK